LDLDLEADLGIDTVKQAETFAAIREVYGIERDDLLALRDFPTLQHVIGFVYDHRPDLRPSAAPAGEPVVAAPVVPVGGEAAVVEGSPEAVELFRRRVPRPVLRPGLDRCVATGVALDADSRVVVMADRAGIGVALAKRLRRRGVDVLLIEDRPEAADLADRLESWAGDGPVTGVYWLPAADIAGNPYEMDITEWHEHLRARVRLLFTTVKTLYHRIGESGSFLVSATRLGGRHGYGGDGAADPVGGAVAGFTKTFSRERPAALVKVVDLPVDRKTAAHAEALIAETLADPGVIEVGLADGRRFSVALVEEPAEDAGAGLELGPESVFVVTGAAGSITSAITADLAAASSGGVFHLIDLTPEPDRSDPDLARFATDRDGLKRDIFERIKASGKRATPALVERELARLERLHAAATAIEAIEAAGGTAYYHSADLRDPQAIDEALAGVRSDQGRIDVLLHAGGLEISRLLSDKAADEFDLVFDVKADGWFNLMRAIGEMPVAATVAFSSIAGRFGNRGQADYSAANDLLCKLAHAMPATRPGTRAIAVDWTAWADIGMATRGSIPRMMEEAGIDMLPSAVGIPFIRRELVAGGGSGEVVVAGALGVLEEPLHASGGFDVEGLGGVEPMAGKVAGWGVDGLEVVTTLDPAVQGFLNDHRVDGTALLPAVMGVEGFAEAAAIGFPDLAVTAVEEVEFVAPFKFYRDEPRQVTIVVRFEEDAGEVVAHCRLIGSRTIAAAPDPVVTTHHTARVRLGSSPDDRTVKVGRSEPAAAVEADDVYAVYFHGPAYQVLAGAGIADGKVVGRMAEGLPDNHAPAGAPTRMRPRLIELVFQTAGIWEIGTERRMGLPTRVGRIVVRPRAAEPAGGIKALVTPSAGGFAAVVVDASGHVLVEVEGYETVTVPGLLPENGVSPIAAAVSN
jgi:NAD(P)-dependent dehydrogenase (short-subunit alcohol dehydrogenase family)